MLEVRIFVLLPLVVARRWQTSVGVGAAVVSADWVALASLWEAPTLVMGENCEKVCHDSG
jgi:hypothetical protein